MYNHLYSQRCSCCNVDPCKKKADPVITTNDIIFGGANDACLNITKPLTLTTVLDKIRAFVRTRLFGITSTSLTVTYPTATCDKIANIELVPSTDVDNALIIGTDGKPFVPNSSSEALSYRSYIALLTQTGVNNPMPIQVFKDDFGDIVFGRVGTGVYTIFSSNFLINKTIINGINPYLSNNYPLSVASSLAGANRISMGGGPVSELKIDIAFTNNQFSIGLQTTYNGFHADDVLNKYHFFVEIRVYN